MRQTTSILAICLFIFIFVWIIFSLNLYDTSGLILDNYNSFIFTSILSFFILILVILKNDPALDLFQNINYLYVAGIVFILYIIFSITIKMPNALFSILILLFVFKIISLYYKDFISSLLWLKHELLNNCNNQLYRYNYNYMYNSFMFRIFLEDGLNYTILPYYNTVINTFIFK